MSELINTHDNRVTIRWKLLTGVSALALTAYVSSASMAGAEDTDRPLIWIELGSQLERASGGDSAYVAPFFSHLDAPIQSPAAIESELPWSLGSEGKISFQPDGSDWIFSAGIRYGRAKSKRNTTQKTSPEPYQVVIKYQTGPFLFDRKCCHTNTVTTNSKAEFADTQSSHQESHLILDFQAGKDVGLGFLGQHGSSTIGAGVRFAQFTSKLDATVHARADMQRYNGFSVPYAYYRTSLAEYPQKYRQFSRFHAYDLTATSTRKTTLIGPSISWNASAALAGNSETSELTLDWGINAAILFGRQKAKTGHDSQRRDLTGYFSYFTSSGYSYTRFKRGYVPGPHIHANSTRSRNVTVPNIGGMAGFSFKWPNAKISIGYRADVFFGAMDGGWDTAKKENRSFMGPFASVSVGVGD